MVFCDRSYRTDWNEAYGKERLAIGAVYRKSDLPKMPNGEGHHHLSGRRPYVWIYGLSEEHMAMHRRGMVQTAPQLNAAQKQQNIRALNKKPCRSRE